MTVPNRAPAPHPATLAAEARSSATGIGTIEASATPRADDTRAANQQPRRTPDVDWPPFADSAAAVTGRRVHRHRGGKPTSMAHTALDLDQRADAHGPLSAQELRILEFERTWWRFGGAKEEAIRDEFDLTATRYYQLLNQLIDRDAALAADPVLVRRLRRLRQQRQEARSAAHRARR